MFERLANFFEALHRRPKTVLLGVAVCVLLAGAGLRNIRFDTSLTSFFPPDSGAAKTLAFLNDAALAGKVAVSFGRDAETPEDVLHAAVAAFAENARKIPSVKNVLHTVDGSTWQTGLADFYELMPQWFDADALDALAPRLEPDAVAAALKRRFSQLARPEGMFLADATRRDPLGFFDAQLAALGNAASNMGYDVVPDAGRLMSRDGLHRLVLLDTDASASDMRASETLVRGLDAALAELPQEVFADVVCAHSHAVANQAAVKRDLALAGALSAALLLAMLLFVYRDARLLMVALVPAFSVLVAFPMCSAVFGGVTFLACAFGSVLAGLSVDYAIHIYRAGGKIRGLMRPLLAGMGTTFAVFCGFFVSGAEGWKQVGCFGATAIAAAFVFSVCVLPVFAKKSGLIEGPRQPSTALDSHRKPSNLMRIGMSLALVVAVCIGLARLKPDNDFSNLNGAGKKVFDAEKRFQKTWGEQGGGRAMVAIKIPYAETVDMWGEFLDKGVVQKLGRDAVSGFSFIAPCPQQRQLNLKAWNHFWSTDNRVEVLSETLRREGAAFGFSDDAFEPFFKTVGAPCEDTGIERLGPLLTMLRERFVFQSKSGGAYAVAYVPDDAETLARITANGAAVGPFSQDEIVILSRAGIPGALAKSFGADAKRVASWMAVLVLFAAWVSLGSLRQVALALLPCAAGAGALFGALGLAGVAFNIIHALAAMLVLGVTFDYGLFLLGVSEGRLEPRVRGDVRLCMATTLAGAAPLLLARHPVIFSLGLALTIGIIAGYFAAAWLLFPVKGKLNE